MIIREAVVADAKAIQAIYAPYVEQTGISFIETEDEYLTQDSVRFHEQLGYKEVAHFHLCGKKFGRWYDMIWMEKIIGEHLET